MTHQHIEARNHFLHKAKNPHGTLKTHGTHYMFCGTLGFRGAPVEEHWSTANIACLKSRHEIFEDIL